VENAHNFMICTSHQTLFNVIKSKIFRCAGHVERTGQRNGAYMNLTKKYEGRDTIMKMIS
jgi:hypothetical protein